MSDRPASLLAWETANNLGNVLLRRSVITEGQLAKAVASQAELRERGVFVLLGQTLVEQGALKPEQLAEAIEEQTRVSAPPHNESVVAEAIAALDEAAERALQGAQTLHDAVVGLAAKVG